MSIDLPNREKAVKLLGEHPAEIGRQVGFTKLQDDIHNDWLIDMLFGQEDETLLAHRLSYKTTCLSIAIALLMIMHPDRSIIFMRKTAGDVTEVVLQVAKILKQPIIKRLSVALWGVEVALTTESMTQLDTNLNKSTRGMKQLVGIGIESSLTGKHAFYVFTDDIVNLKDRQSTAEREKTKGVYQELQNVVEREGRIFNTGTPWHKEDAISTLMPNVHKHTYEDTGLISDEKIQELRDSMLPSLFAANYELKHIAGEDVLFGTPKQGADPALVQNGISHLDSAFYGEDYTAFTQMAYHDGKYYVLGKLWRKHVEDCFPMIKELYEKNLSGKLYNETNADKGLVAKSLRQMGLRVVTYHEDTNKHVKIVTHLYKIWKDIIFVEGTDKAYIEQICDYTEDAAHDDAPDSCSCCARIMTKKRNSADQSVQPYLM